MNPRHEPQASHRSETGATAVEYGLMVALIAAAIVASVMALGGGVDGLFTAICGGSSPFNC